MDSGVITLLEASKSYIESLFREEGGIIRPVLFVDDGSVLTVMRVNLEAVTESTTVEERHFAIQATIAKEIRNPNVLEVLVCFQAYMILEEDGKAINLVLVLNFSDAKEIGWISQVHGNALGKWILLPEHRNLCGFQGLWKNARSYRWN